MEGTNNKPPTPIFYISVRCLQLPLCLGTLFACGALMFYFDNDIQLTDSAMGHHRVRRDAFAFPVDGALSGGSGDTTSTWGETGVSAFTASRKAEEEYGRTRAAGTRSPQVVLLAAGLLSTLTTIASVGIHLCQKRSSERAMCFFAWWDAFLTLLWTIGSGLLLRIMNRYDIYDKHRVQAKFYKATMILAITIWVTFLYTFAHAFRVKRRLTASGFGDTTCTSSTLSMPGYVAVPTRGRQSPTSRRSTSGRSTKDQGRTKGPARTNDLYMSKYPPIDPASIYPPLPPQLQYPQLPAPLSPIYSPPIHSSQTHEYFPPPNTYVQPLDQPSSSTVRP